MKTCLKCHKSIKNEAKFCPICGAQQAVKGEMPKQEAAIEKIPNERHRSSQDQSGSQRLEKIIENNNYLKFLKDNVLNPSLSVRNESYFGLINLAILVILPPIVTTKAILLGIEQFLMMISNMLGKIGGASIPSVDVQKQLAVIDGTNFIGINACYVLAQVALVLAFSMLVSKKKSSILSYVNQFFAPLSIVVVIQAATAGLVLLGLASKIIFIASFVSLVLISVNAIGLIWENTRNFRQQYYLVLASFVVQLVINYNLIRSLFETLERLTKDSFY